MATKQSKPQVNRRRDPCAVCGHHLSQHHCLGTCKRGACRCKRYKRVK